MRRHAFSFELKPGALYLEFNKKSYENLQANPLTISKPIYQTINN
jgi:hypothetical protein